MSLAGTPSGPEEALWRLRFQRPEEFGNLSVADADVNH